MSEWETHCEACGQELTPDPDWIDERTCETCNTVYLDPDSEAAKAIANRLETP